MTREEQLVAAPAGDTSRPKLRADCVDGPRPCPWVGCRYHLYLDVSPRGGLKLNFPDLEPAEIPETCALDVAEHDGVTLEQVGEALNVTRERIRQIEALAMRRLRAWGPCNKLVQQLRAGLVDDELSRTASPLATFEGC